MKRKLLFFCMIFCPILIYSQTIRTIEKGNDKTIMVTGKNGKISTRVYTAEPGILSDYQIDSKFSTDNIQNSSKQIQQKKDNTFSLTMNFLDSPSDFPVSGIIITNSDTVYYRDNMTFSYPSTYQIDIPQGEYEIIAISNKPSLETPLVAIVSFQNYILNSDDTLDVDFNQMAINRIESNFIDEMGNVIPADNNTILHGITIVFPPSIKQSTYSNLQLGTSPVFMLSDFNPDYKFFSEFIYAKPLNTYTTYSQTISGINNDTVFINHETDYKILKSVLNATPNAGLMYLTHGVSEINDSTYVFYIYQGFNEKYPVQHGDTLNLYLNNALSNHRGIDNNSFSPLILFWQKPNQGSEPYKENIKGPAPLVSNTDSIMLLEYGAHISSPNLIFKSGESFPLGSTVPYSQTWGFNSSNEIATYPMSFGQYSENRATDGNYSTYRIIHDDQVIASGNLVDFSGSLSPVEPETYTWEQTNPNYKVHQKQGKVMLTATFDLSNEDPNFPVFTSFRVFDNNNTIGDELIHHESASILFSTYDYVQDYNIAEEPFSVKAYYNIDGEGGWNELLVNDHPALYDPYLFGYFYSCDLTPVLAQFDNIGYINFKIDVIDYAGNVCTQTWSPLAFVNNLIGIQASVSLSTQSMTVSPNPVNGHCIIDFNLPEAAQSELMVLDINGKLIESILSSKLDAGNHQISWSPSPSLINGTYLIKLVTAKGIKTSKIFIQ